MCFSVRWPLSHTSSKRLYFLPAGLLLSLVSAGCRGQATGQISALPTSLPSSGVSVSGNSYLSGIDVGPAIERANDYMIRACYPDGHFIYEVNLNPQIAMPKRYNIVRHGGTIYALGALYAANPRAETREAMLRSAAFMRQRALKPIPGHPDLLAIWEIPVDGAPAEHGYATLGASALGLVGLLSVEKVAPGSTAVATLRGLGKYVVSLQKPSGEFRDHFVPDGEDAGSKSLYFPGEAALALTMLYEKDPNPLWLERASKSLTFLAKSRQGQVDVPADCWALIASAELLPIYDRAPSGKPRDVVLAHLVQICRSIVNEKRTYRFPSERGSLTSGVGTTATASRLEGLQTALKVLPAKEVQLRREIETLVTGGIGFLVRAQVKGGAYSGGFPEVILPSAEDDQNGLAPRLEDSTIRIDYVQHAVSALLLYREAKLKALAK